MRRPTSTPTARGPCMFKLTRTTLRLTRVAFLLLMASSSMAYADIMNGSFETPAVPAGGFTLFPPNVIPGWTVVGPAGTSVGIVSGTFTQLGVMFPAQDGSQWLDLTGLGSNSTEGVTQSATVTAGHTYQLSYFIGN